MRWTAHSGHSPELVGQGGTRGPTQYPVLSCCCIPPSGNRGGGSKSPRERWHIEASSSLIVRTTCMSHASPSSVWNLRATCDSFLRVQPACHVCLLPPCATCVPCVSPSSVSHFKVQSRLGKQGHKTAAEMNSLNCSAHGGCVCLRERQP